ncbi:hypothetical protein ACFE04_004159 [Oxalis oulophora]
MAVAKSSSSISESSSDCYKVQILNQIILDAKCDSTFKDRYVLGNQLGWGQFGIIRTCSDKLTGELLACKSISKDRLVTSDDTKSVKLEIEIMTRLSGHPNVVDLKAVYEDEDYVHLVMELCAGGELFHWLERCGRFSETEARVIFRNLMLVVSYCHDNGIVHRDLKPENILLATKSSSSPIKLADFGLATYIKPGQKLHGTVGSPFYIAPEVLAGGYNEAADIWSAGVILYILLSGMPPFWGKTKSQIFDAVKAADLHFPCDPWDRISESAKKLVQGMLCTDPSRRLTAEQVLEHSWIKNDESYPEELKRYNCGELDLGGCSFSTPLISRNRDISFGIGSPIICDVASPTFTCRASLSPFTCGGFSFRSSGSYTLEFSTPVASAPSFSFFSPDSEVEQNSTCRVDASSEGTSLENSLALPDFSACCSQEAKELERKTTDVKRAGGTIGYRILRMHSKRNRTIGLGECEQLDFIASESVMRWASCTNLPTNLSLRASLVC